MDYCGLLERIDPLYHFLRDHIIPPMNGHTSNLDFHVSKIGGSKDVYLYEEASTTIKVIGKFYPPSNGQNGMAWRNWAEHEYYNLCMARAYGLTESPHRIIRPLGYSSFINNVLFLEYFEGVSLSEVISGALAADEFGLLFEKLRALAYFLATLHNRTANGQGVDFLGDVHYLQGIIQTLISGQVISFDEGRELGRMGQTWLEQAFMWEDQQVLVHGDATPQNFLFGMGMDVTAIDLERMKYADRVYDVGRIAGELQHFFLMENGNKLSAEPFIKHFLHEYASHFPDAYAAFLSITKRVPFHMALALLRIARNSWVPLPYRRCLVREALSTLQSMA